jgi:hypothetical protein
LPDFQLIHRLIAAQFEENAEITVREKRRLGELMVSQSNEGQRAAFDQVMAAINDTENEMKFRISFSWMALKERGRRSCTTLSSPYCRDKGRQ